MLSLHMHQDWSDYFPNVSDPDIFSGLRLRFTNKYLPDIQNLYIRNSIFYKIISERGGAIIIISDTDTTKMLVDNSNFIYCHTTAGNGGAICYYEKGSLVIDKCCFNHDYTIKYKNYSDGRGQSVYISCYSDDDENNPNINRITYSTIFHCGNIEDDTNIVSSTITLYYGTKEIDYLNQTLNECNQICCLELSTSGGSVHGSSSIEYSNFVNNTAQTNAIFYINGLNADSMNVNLISNSCNGDNSYAFFAYSNRFHMTNCSLIDNYFINIASTGHEWCFNFINCYIYPSITVTSENPIIEEFTNSIQFASTNGCLFPPSHRYRNVYNPKGRFLVLH